MKASHLQGATRITFEHGEANFTPASGGAGAGTLTMSYWAAATLAKTLAEARAQTPPSPETMAWLVETGARVHLAEGRAFVVAYHGDAEVPGCLQVDASGATIDEAVANLRKRFPDPEPKETR